MSNAPKTGFWSSIPGLITATAGFLSAATGAIVALNQTGVVDLKKMTGSKPAEQTSPAENTPATTSGKGTESQPGSSLTAVQPDNQKGTPATEKKDIPPFAESRQPLAETKSSLPEPKPAPAVEEPRRMATAGGPKPAQPAEAPTSAPPTPEKQPGVLPAPATTKPPADKPTERSAESKPAAEPPKPLSTPAERERVVREVEKKTPETKTPEVVKAPPPPDRKEPAAVQPSNKDKERKADTRGPAAAEPSSPPRDDARGPKIVRAPGEQVAQGEKKKDAERALPSGRDKTPGGPPEARKAGHDRGQQLDLTGLKMTIPAGWMRAEASGAETVLKIPDPAGDGTVQISRYMGAKGPEMEEKTIDRWVGQASKAGSPVSRGDAKIERRQHGGIRVTTVEIAGTGKSAAGRDGGAPDEKKFVGAIVDLPAGPYLITITGPAKSMAKWDAAIEEFLRSVKAE